MNANTLAEKQVLVLRAALIEALAFCDYRYEVHVLTELQAAGIDLSPELAVRLELGK